MGRIRYVGKTGGCPYLMCKKKMSQIVEIFTVLHSLSVLADMHYTRLRRHPLNLLRTHHLWLINTFSVETGCEKGGKTWCYHLP